MKKSFNLILKNYPVIPQSLRDANGNPLTSISIDLRKVALSIVRDQRSTVTSNFIFKSFGNVKQSIYTPVYEQLLDIITTDPFFQLNNDSIPYLKDWRRVLSYTLATGIGRTVLEDYLDIVFSDNLDYYFAKYQYGKKFRLPKINAKITRPANLKGDAPDLVCLLNSGALCLAELKGKISESISDKNLNTWKGQFNNITLVSTDNIPPDNSNHLCAIRFANSEHKRVKSKIVLFDPSLPDDRIKVESDRETVVINHFIKSLFALGFTRFARLLQFLHLRGIAFPENEDIVEELQFVIIQKTNDSWIFPNTALTRESKWLVGLDINMFNLILEYMQSKSKDERIIVIDKTIQYSKSLGDKKSEEILYSKDGFVVVPKKML